MRRFVVCTIQLLGYLAAIITATILVMVLTKWLVGDWEAGGPHLRILGDGLLTSLGILLTNLAIARFLRSREVFLGWPRFRAGALGFARGALIGFGMAGLMLALTLALGGGRIVLGEGSLPSYLRYVVPLGGCLLLAALAEESLFRGYPLTRLSGVLGRGWANLLMGLLFAAAHLGSAGSNRLVTLNIVLGSLVVGSLRFTPGGIPAAWGFHFVWNYLQVLCGATLSLEDVDVPSVTFSASGSTVLSGGAFGPEAGIGATVATVVTLVFFFVYFRRRGIRDLPWPLTRGSSGQESELDPADPLASSTSISAEADR